MTHDPRLTLARPELAADGLEGCVRAERFVSTRRMRATTPCASLRSAPRSDAEQVDQLLFGEIFDALDIVGEFAWGQAARDGYVGWAPLSALSTELAEATHRVAALRTFAHAAPSIKSPASGPFSLNALMRVVETQGRMALVQDAGWTPLAHLEPIGAAFKDPATVAEAFLGTPYLWGGRDSVGVDCSGLVQQAFQAAGRACPRDTDLQADLGWEVPRQALVRGDLVFWRGHVGMMADADRLLHANAHHMAVAIELLSVAEARIAQSGGGEPTAFRRP